MSEYLLEMKNIYKSFGSVDALKDVSINLRAGEVLALMGENGAGKSTLMNILSGSVSANCGEILVGGKKVHINDPVTAISHGIIKIHQELQIVPEASVAENIFLNRWHRNAIGIIDYKTMEREAVRCLGMLDVDINPRRRLRDLRIGEQQLVEIAKAISLDSKILIMDEPTSAISEKDALKLFMIINRLRAEGKGIIYITHRMEEIFKIADRLTIMRDGEYIDTLVADGCNTDDIIKLMVGREVNEQYPKSPTNKGDVIFEVKNLNYKPNNNSFDRSLKNISISVRSGEVLGIAGLAGAGRTEFFNCIAGKHSGVVSGEFYVEGKRVNLRAPKDAIASGISFATEDRKGTGLVLSRGIGENITYPLLKNYSRFLIIKRKREKDAVDGQMKALKIKAPNINVTVSSLSGGNQQKVVLAKWLLTKPKILLLDEPTRGIDVGAKVEIYHLINKLAKEGIAIIMISSELPEVIGISDRVITFCEGEVTGEFNHGEVTQEMLLNSATKASDRELYNGRGVIL